MIFLQCLALHFFYGGDSFLSKSYKKDAKYLSSLILYKYFVMVKINQKKKLEQVKLERFYDFMRAMNHCMKMKSNTKTTQL